MNKKHILVLSGLVLVAVLFSAVQLVLAVIPNPGHGTSDLEGDASLNMNSQKITNLATPTADGDATTKAYVDAAGGGIKYWQIVNTAASFNGAMSRRKGANDKCQTEFGADAIFFNSDMLVNARMGGTAIMYDLTSTSWFDRRGTTATTDGYPALGAVLSSWNTGSASIGNCNGWNSSASGNDGANIQHTGSVAVNPCNNSLRIACAVPK